MIEIVELKRYPFTDRRTAWYLMDDIGIVAGPFERLTEAQMWLHKYFKDEIGVIA